jgi:thymidylate synthase ThyX
MISAKIIADSISEHGVRLTTMQLCYPRFIHSEFMTHRTFSRNASSSRAIPVQKMLDMVRNEPAMPIHWGQNKAGMQASEELSRAGKEYAEVLWRKAANEAADIAESMMKLGLHKQATNRILEPFQHIHVVVTATEWSNFFELRAHEDAQPEIHELAFQMRYAMDSSNPVLRKYNDGVNSLHLPYVTEEERALHSEEELMQMSSARNCRVSYLKHDGSSPSIEEDLKLCHRLVGAEPLHASPFEHVAMVAEQGYHNSGNFRGWVQYRKLVEARFETAHNATSAE